MKRGERIGDEIRGCDVRGELRCVVGGNKGVRSDGIECADGVRRIRIRHTQRTCALPRRFAQSPQGTVIEAVTIVGQRSGSYERGDGMTSDPMKPVRG